ncbi:MAG: methyltransferase domain-containing protein, partial [Pseudonocardiaceae bacterium]
MRGCAVHRALEAEVAAARRRLGVAPRVLDVGGGSGVWAVPLARSGCLVTVVEPSPNALATLHRRAADAGVQQLVSAVQG